MIRQLSSILRHDSPRRMFRGLPLLCAAAILVAALPARAQIIDIPSHTGPRDQKVQENYVEAFRQMTDQMTHVMLQQIPIIGVFLDAKHQLETQRLLGEAAAKANRDYTPNEQICAFGTLARSTALSKYKIDKNIKAINTILQKRELLHKGVSSAWGPYGDKDSRLEKFKTTYCDRNDNNRTLGMFCAPGAPRKNADLDYRRLIDGNLTLDIDFTDGNAMTATEEDVLALARNLYANTTLQHLPRAMLIPPNGTFRELHNMRMLSAVRSVARHSFATITAMRSTSSGLKAEQLRQVMKNLGVPENEVVRLIGANPSYFAQMEILTQKIFQDPTYVVNLYTGPANVARMSVIVQALRIMSDRDKLDAALRREMLLSMIVEMRLRERQNGYVGQLDRLISGP